MDVNLTLFRSNVSEDSRRGTVKESEEEEEEEGRLKMISVILRRSEAKRM